MDHVPAISVVMPVYNAEPYLAAAVQSIFRQTFSNFELIAIDDGSTDNSLQILNALADDDDRLRIISRPNTGIVGALNDGIAAGRAEFIARMDSDDIAFPERLARQLAFLTEHPQCVAVGTGLLHIDPDGDPIRIDRWAATHAEIDHLLLHGGGGLAHPTACIRANTLQRVGGYRPKYEWIEDKDLWLRLGEIGELANLPDILLAYRLHDRSICWDRERDQYPMWQALLAETYARRGIDEELPKIRPRSRRGGRLQAVQRTWIRTAARHGYLKTAFKHARQLIQQEPLAPGTWWTLARAAVSYVR